MITQIDLTTSICFGDTLAKIAEAKAGIIAEGVPVISESSGA